jgi:hypothetical protein
MKLPTLTCLRCGYSWYPRSPDPPRVCASKTCKSPYWDRPRKNRTATDKQVAGAVKKAFAERAGLMKRLAR